MLLFLVGCDLPLTDIAIQGDSATLVEAGTLVEELLADFGFADFVSMDLTQAEELRNQGVQPGDISAAALTAFSLTAEQGAPDLSFFDRMDLSVSAPALDTVLLAQADAFPAGDATVQLLTTGTDITDYLVSEAMTLEVGVEAHRPDEDTTVRANWTVVVTVTTQGAVSNL